MNRLRSNFISIFGSDIARRLIGFITVAYLARVIGISGFGVISIGFVVLSYALAASTAGLTSFGIRAVARGEAAIVLPTILGLRMAGALGVFLLVVGVAAFLPDTTVAVVIILFSLSLFPNALLLDWYFQGKEVMTMVGISRLSSAAIYLGLVVVLVKSPFDLTRVALASVAGDVLAAALLFWASRRLAANIRLSFSLKGWKPLLAQALPLGAGSFVGQIAVNLPMIVLGIMMTNRDVGVYSAASKLVFFLLILDRLIATLLLPASSRLQKLSPETLASALSSALKWIIVLALPLCVGGMLLADRIVPFVFGDAYLPAADVFRILVWYFLLTTVHTVYTSGMIAVGRERTYSLVMTVGAIISAVALIMCISAYGVQGASAAFVVAEGATLVLMRGQLRRSTRVSLPKPLLSPIIAALLMAAVLLLLPSIHVLISIAIGTTTYIIALFLTHGVTRDELAGLLKGSEWSSA